jgi:hypothetical protein
MSGNRQMTGEKEIFPDAYTYILSVIKIISMTTKDMDSIQLGYPGYCQQQAGFLT